MPPSPPTAQARTSCDRCHRRKKKCDRTLPRCDACRLAQVACSFLQDDDNRQVGSYPIAFVRGLEEKIKELEKQLAAVPETQHLVPAEHSFSAYPDHAVTVQSSYDSAAFPDFDMNDDLLDAWAFPEPSKSISFADELKLLSLEATAERHLGSSSGLSFAKLTQSVLRRLSPDKADFVFELSSDGDDQLQAKSSSSGPFHNSDLLQLNGTVSRFPTLFGAFSMSKIEEPEAVLQSLRFPAESDIDRLVGFYFAHSHTLYPMVHRNEFLSALNRVRVNSEDPLASSPLWLFRIWMILAIGSTSYCSVTLGEESESMLYYNKAMCYFEAALEFGDMAALEVIMLQVSYSFFNQLGPNTWILVGLATRMATGIGLHTSSSYDNLPNHIVQRRKRLFFCIYMMDRVVSMALGRPFALHDDDVDITPFSDNEDAVMETTVTYPQATLEPSQLAIPLHILALRRLASKIVKNVFSESNKRSPLNIQAREEIIRLLHKELIDWRRNMPFPLPDVHTQVPHLSSSWFDFNYYTHLAMLYRPSPLLPTLDEPRVKILATAAAMSIREAVSMHRQQRFAYNWLNLLAVYTSTLSLIYAVTAQPDNLINVLRETKAIDDLELAVGIFDTLSVKFTAAKKIGRMVEEIVKRYKDLYRPDLH